MLQQIGRASDALFALVLLAGAARAQLAPTLQITSPANDAVVYAGQTLTVTVNADSSEFQSVWVSSRAAGGQLAIRTAPPYEFPLALSREASLGPETIVAVGYPRSHGDLVYSVIDVDIERQDAPLRLRLDFGSLHLRYVGDRDSPGVTGLFADGSLHGLEHSKFTKYSCDNPAVATVEENGVVTAVAPGKASITITYNPPTGDSLSAQVPVVVPLPVVVFPAKSSLYTTQTEEFSAGIAIRPDLDQSVTWSINPQLGSIDERGVYTAPASLPSWRGVTVTATSVAEPDKSASAQVWIFPPVSVKVTPATGTVAAGGSLDFDAVVKNGSAKVVWSVTPAGVGTIQSLMKVDFHTYQPLAGAIYHAPASVAAPWTVTVTATSVWDNSKAASAQVSLVP